MALRSLLLLATLGAAPAPEPVLWTDVPSNGGWWVQKPPARFTRGQGSALVIFTTPEQVGELCGRADAKACATRLDGIPAPVVVLPEPCTPEFTTERYAQLVCHENSHAFGGWKHEVG